jgi:hypothetical protein
MRPNYELESHASCTQFHVNSIMRYIVPQYRQREHLLGANSVPYRPSGLPRMMLVVSDVSRTIPMSDLKANSDGGRPMLVKRIHRSLQAVYPAELYI